MAVSITAFILPEEEVEANTGTLKITGSHSETFASRGATMSIDGTKVLFEGFLQKRKDTLVSGKTHFGIFFL